MSGTSSLQIQGEEAMPTKPWRRNRDGGCGGCGGGGVGLRWGLGEVLLWVIGEGIGGGGEPIKR